MSCFCREKNRYLLGLVLKSEGLRKPATIFSACPAPGLSRTSKQRPPSLNTPEIYHISGGEIILLEKQCHGTLVN